MSGKDKQFMCKRCLMDRTAEEIEFTETGCTFCDLARANKPKTTNIPNLRGKGQYDVILGLSGGTDSAMCLHYLVECLKLRVLTFTIDTGYNKTEADENILKMVEKLEVPFYRYTIDLDKFKELQAAFLVSGTRNIEIPTDHVLYAALLEMADKYNIKTIISGGNWNTESIMPESWGYQARDLVHIKDVYKKHTGKVLTGLPMCGLLKWNWYKWVKKIKTVNILDHIYYHRGKSIEFLTEEYGFKDTGEKHCENYFTWWFQNYYLFEKFGIDKRKAHLSSLILSHQMTRQEAMDELEKNPVYPTLGMESRVLRYPKRSHKDYKTDEKLFNFISWVVKKLR